MSHTKHPRRPKRERGILPPGWYADVAEYVDVEPYFKVVDSVGPASSEELALEVGRKLAEKYGGVTEDRYIMAYQLFSDGSKRVGDITMAGMYQEIKKLGGG